MDAAVYRPWRRMRNHALDAAAKGAEMNSTTPSPEQVNKVLAVVFGGWKPSDEPYPFNDTPPAYADSLALAVELAERVCTERNYNYKLIRWDKNKFDFWIEEPYSDVDEYGESVERVQVVGSAQTTTPEEAISLALYSCAIQLGLTEGV
jgi:hypothetical protein